MKSFCYALIIFLAVLSSDEESFAQSRGKIDSLEARLSSEETDSNRLKLLTELSYKYVNIDLESAVDYGEKAVDIASKISSEVGLAQAHYRLGVAYYYLGEHHKALDHYLESLKIREKRGDKKAAAACMKGIALVYRIRKNFENAMKYYQQSLTIWEEFDDKSGKAGSFNGIGLIYKEQKKYDEAIDYFVQSLSMREELSDSIGIAMCLGNIGGTYQDAGKIDKAIEYHLRSMELDKKLNDIQGLAISLVNLGDCYAKQRNFDKAIQSIEESLEIAQEIGFRDLKKYDYQVLAETYSKAGDYKNAYEYLTHYTLLKDSLLNETNSKQIAEIQTKYETEKKEKEIALLTKDNEIKDLAVSRQKLLRNSFIAGLILALGMAFLLYNRYRLKQRANALLAEKNYQITASINYASRIQSAILPPDELIKEHLPDSFILFKPKDIVSGDFYWLARKNDKVFIVAADCTGHGVPGAFMSMIGNTLLNETIIEKSITDPSEILDHVNQGIIKVLRQRNDDASSMDGMDMALCAFTPLGASTKKDKGINQPESEEEIIVQFAGAQRPLFHVSKGILGKIKGDIQSIGGHQIEGFKKFTAHEVVLKRGESFYISSDGYQDQFGGPGKKKFLTARFQALLVENHHLPMEEQGKLFDKTIEDWKMDFEQIDDILVIGVRV